MRCGIFAVELAHVKSGGIIKNTGYTSKENSDLQGFKRGCSNQRLRG